MQQDQKPKALYSLEKQWRTKKDPCDNFFNSEIFLFPIILRIPLNEKKEHICNERLSVFKT